jgi:hypothetical protein
MHNEVFISASAKRVQHLLFKKAVHRSEILLGVFNLTYVSTGCQEYVGYLAEWTVWQKVRKNLI